MRNDGRIIPDRDFQQSAYEESRALAEETLRIGIDSKEWNEFFFKAIQPYISEISILIQERDEIINAVRVLKDAVQ